MPLDIDIDIEQHLDAECACVLAVYKLVVFYIYR